jgi:hypothetical protein
MPRSLPMLLAGLCLVGCGKKNAGPDAAGAVDTGDASAVTAQMPDGKDATSFAKKLIGTTITNWDPSDVTGASFKYNEMTFDESGHWTADATLKAGFEEIDCTESGSWVIDVVESANDATMTWNVQQTTCATREKGLVLRVQMLLPSAGQYKINFR